MFQACLSAHRARVGELKTTHKKQTKECELAVQRSIDVTMYHMNEALDALQRSQNEMRANSLKMQQKSFMFLKTMDAVSKASREFESENQRLFWFPRVADEWTQNLEFVAAVLDKMVLKYHVEADAGLEGPVEQSIE